jgi:hypothetical protein
LPENTFPGNLFFMKKIKPLPRSCLIALLLATSVFLLTRCMHGNDSDAERQAGFSAFAGSETCRSCHRNIHADFIHTSHYLTSMPATEKSIMGSFAPGSNVYQYDLVRKVVMEKRDSGYYEVFYKNDAEQTARRFDIVIGSGTRGQTYLSWLGNSLFQLPVSYFRHTNNWANSPGYLPHKIDFNRPIIARCLECHSTYANKTSAPGHQPEAFDRNQIIYGITCEKCHGPAAKHVAFQTQHPEETKGKYILNPAAMSGRQNLELCALCHGGRLHPSKPSFQFTAGDRLADYFFPDTSKPDPADIDVHGNQYGLLSSSKCFRISGTMTCVTCHDPHKNQRGQLALFSQRCMDCHNKEHGNFCKMEAEIGPGIVQNCIDCHMPKKPSRLIAVLLSGEKQPTAATIRSHYISIYPEQTGKWLEERKTSGKSAKVN